MFNNTFCFPLDLQDVVYALAHATGKTGRFTLIERWRNNERLLAPQEHPLKVSWKVTRCPFGYFHKGHPHW